MLRDRRHFVGHSPGVVGALIAVVVVVAVTTASVVIAMNALVGRVRAPEQRSTTCVFTVSHSNFPFVPTLHKAIAVSEISVVFDGASPSWRSRVVSCALGRRAEMCPRPVCCEWENDRDHVCADLESVMLRSCVASEFSVVMTPLCSCTVDERVLPVVVDCGKRVTTPIGVKAETMLTTQLHFDDVV